MFNDFLYNDCLFNDIISLGQVYPGYSRGSYLTLPTGIINLSHAYSEQDYLDVAAIDAVRVLQGDVGKYAMHQFKDLVTPYSRVKVEWYGRSTLAPGESIVFLQIYNITTSLWETIASEGTVIENVDFTLTADIESLTDYKNEDGGICCRVYQFMS